MSVIRKETKKLVYLSAYFYKVSNFFGGGGGGGGWGGSINLPREPPFLKNKPHYTYKNNAQKDKMLNRCKLKVSKKKLTRLPNSIRKINLVTFLGFEGNILFLFWFFTLEQLASLIFCLWLSPSLVASRDLAARLHTTTRRKLY